MSLRRWWQDKSGPAKAVVALAMFLLLQIGLCFASAQQTGTNPGLFVFQGILLLLTIVLLFAALVTWVAGR